MPDTSTTEALRNLLDAVHQGQLVAREQAAGYIDSLIEAGEAALAQQARTQAVMRNLTSPSKLFSARRSRPNEQSQHSNALYDIRPATLG